MMYSDGATPVSEYVNARPQAMPLDRFPLPYNMLHATDKVPVRDQPRIPRFESVLSDPGGLKTHAPHFRLVNADEPYGQIASEASSILAWDNSATTRLGAVAGGTGLLAIVLMFL